MHLSINPATGREVARFEDCSAAELDAALAAAVKAQADWKTTTMTERSALLRRIAGALRENAKAYAALITLEMGKPRKDAEAEIEKCAWNCDYYAEHGPRFLADQPRDTGAAKSHVAFDPLGVVLAVMPWNFPFWQFFRFAAPALMAGNGIILKHAANVPQCARAIGDAMAAAGTPAGLVATPLFTTEAVAGLIADPRIAAVTLTGSTKVGQIIASEAGKVLKKQVLELGGSDPFIVLEDADLVRAAEAGIKSRFGNAGQSCIAAKRFIVVEAVAEKFVAALVEKARALKMGDPAGDGTTLGPLARADLRDTLHGQVQASLKAGAVLKLGGQLPGGDGFFYPPTILDHVTAGMAAFEEETFGPLLAVVRARDAEHAIALANQTEYGLGASLWTADGTKAQILARRIEAGSVFINALVASDPRLPFGGIKQSGYGRELSDFGIHEFVNIKSVFAA
jgi:acyl-CoA reductase-like NAD-dependent aldehyde dehydrogenase